MHSLTIVRHSVSHRRRCGIATNIVRAKAIAEGIADATLTNAVLTDIADAFAYTYQRGKTLTNEQKSIVYVNALRAFTRQVVRDWKITVAMEATRQATAPTADIDLGTDGVIP